MRVAASRGNQTHGDYFWAAALALRAATGYGPAEVVIAAA